MMGRSNALIRRGLLQVMYRIRAHPYLFRMTLALLDRLPWLRERLARRVMSIPAGRVHRRGRRGHVLSPGAGSSDADLIKYRLIRRINQREIS